MRGKNIFKAVFMLVLFVVFTVLVTVVDVGPIGPLGEYVGFSSVNSFFHRLTGVNLSLYVITDVLSVIPLVIAVGFALLGLFQWMKRGSIFKVDRDIIMMGVFYAAVIFAYALFEKLSINVRPILIEGRLEPSYPSSTTMLVICVMSAAFIWADRHVKNKALKRLVLVSCTAFSLFMILARILSGVHWLTDIIGAFLLSGALVMIYNKVS